MAKRLSDEELLSMYMNQSIRNTSISDVESLHVEKPTVTQSKPHLQTKKKTQNSGAFKRALSFVLVLTMLVGAGKLVKDKVDFQSIKQNAIEDIDDFFDTFSKMNTEPFVQNDEKYVLPVYTSMKDVKEIESIYDDATTMVSDLYDTLDLDNTLECYYVFNYLCDNGYLGLTTKIDEKYLDLNEDNCLGADVLYSKGNCRHQTDYYTKTLQKYNMEAYPAVCFMGESGKEYSFSVPNHVVTIANDNGVVTYQDTVNNEIFDKYGSQYDEVRSSLKSASFIYMMPEFDMAPNVIGPKITNDQKNTIKNLEVYDDDGITYEFLESKYSSADEKLKNHYQDVNDFIDDYEQEILQKLPSKPLA